MNNSDKLIFYLNEEIDELLNEFNPNENIWSLADGELYGLCQKYPDHKNTKATIAKLWFIGRTYAAALERRRNVIVDTNTLYTTVAEDMKTYFDDELDSIKKHNNYDINVFKQTLELHKRLTESFAIESKNENVPVKRSLASKYLNFHCPDKFYIYDSNATFAISKLVSTRLKGDYTIEVGEYKNLHVDADDEYRKFCLKAIALHGFLRKEGYNFGVKQLDNFLLYCANKLNKGEND